MSQLALALALALTVACGADPAPEAPASTSASASAAAPAPAPAPAAEAAAETPLKSLKLIGLEGGPLPAETYDDEVVLFVNVASRCGFTPQYEPLQAVHAKYRDRGFTVIGVPCNQFGGQEPGSPQEIATFCERNYGVNFPILEKQDVNGEARSPLYQALVASGVGGGRDVAWNFEKFLVNRQGEVIGRWDSRTTPDDAAVTEAIERAL